jgi:DNA invertase Pin-like site-specific DNA recombinase
MTSTIATAADVTRAGLYQRVSTSEQDTARQHAANRQAAALHGWQVTEYDPDEQSASMFAGAKGGANRKSWRQMVNDLPRLDLLVVHDVSRADRQLETWAPLLGECRRRGVRIYVTNEDETYDLSKPTHWQRLANAGTQAEMESLVKSQQIRSGKAYWASLGHPVSGKAPYGVKRINDPYKAKNRWLRDEADPDTGPVAARIVAEVAAGHGYAVIARGLDAADPPIPTPGGSAEWDHRTIVKIAAHPVLHGVLIEAGLLTGEQAAKARARVNDTKHTGRGKAPRPSAQVHRYSSCLACEHCGEQVRGAARKGGPVYRCPVGHVTIPAPALDAWVDRLAVGRLSRPDLAGLFAGGDTAAASAARAEADRLQAELDEWVSAGISARAYAIKERELLPRIEAAQAAARDAESPSALAGLPDGDPQIVAARWEALTVSARKAALRALAPRAILRHGKRGIGRTPVAERVVLWPDD